MKSFLNKSLKIIIPLLLGVIVFLLVYRNNDFPELLRIIKEEAVIGWIIVSLLFGIFSNLIRAHRWQAMLAPLGHKPSFSNTVYAVFSLYFINALIPRAGEIYRCAVLNKYEKIPFPRLLGTVFSERIFDALTMLFAIFIGLILQFDIYRKFFLSEFRVSEWLDRLSPQWISAILVLLVLLAGIAWFYIRKKVSLYEYMQRIISDIWKGMCSIGMVRNKTLFFIETILIWLCYYLQLYVCMYAFDFTTGLTWVDAFTIYIMGTLGMLIPVPQGIGTWHFMVIGTLTIMGVAGAQAGAFALFVHATQTLLLIVLGFFAMVMLPLTNK